VLKVGVLDVSQEIGDLAGVDAVVLDLAAVDRFHVESVAEGERDLLAGCGRAARS